MTLRFAPPLSETLSLGQRHSVLSCEAPQELLLRGFAPFIFGRGIGTDEYGRQAPVLLPLLVSVRWQT